jgi:hypothetical protein
MTHDRGFADFYNLARPTCAKHLDDNQHDLQGEAYDVGTHISREAENETDDLRLTFAGTLLELKDRSRARTADAAPRGLY